jgi:hypothetical protein
MNLEFQSTLFSCRADLCAAIAESYITAGGSNSDSEVAHICRMPASELAVECVGLWDLNTEWLEERGITIADLCKAFSSFAARAA